MVQKVAVKREFKARLEILSVNPAVNGYFFELGKDKAAKGMELAPRYNRTLTPTAPTDFSLRETYTYYMHQSFVVTNPTPGNGGK